LLDAVRAAAPENDFGLVDLEPGGSARGETWRFADGAVDIDGAPAVAADEVVMVVADSGLEERSTSGRLDPAHEPGAVKGAHDVVHSLRRQRADPFACAFFDLLDRDVGWKLIKDAENCDPCGSYTQAMGAKNCRRIRELDHPVSLPVNWNDSREGLTDEGMKPAASVTP
jgi:hypothetical protein